MEISGFLGLGDVESVRGMALKNSTRKLGGDGYVYYLHFGHVFMAIYIGQSVSNFTLKNMHFILSGVPKTAHMLGDLLGPLAPSMYCPCGKDVSPGCSKDP